MSRVAIVTGGGTGIGAGVARLFAAQGLNVVLVGRRPGPLEDVRAAIGDRAHTIAADVGTPDAPVRIVEETLATFGRIDVIVNNAAIIQTGRLHLFAWMFDHHYAVNVAGPFFLVAAALPALRESEDAAVVNVSSSVGSIVKPGNMLYGSTKAALEYLTRAWAYELGEDGIRVNCIAPGPVRTPIHATYSDDLQRLTSTSRVAFRSSGWARSSTSLHGSGSSSPPSCAGRPGMSST